MERLLRRAHSYATVVVIGLMSAVLWAEANSGARCTVDEPAWITSGYLSWRLATKLAPASEWSTAFADPKIGAWGHQNPPVAKLLIGMATALAKAPADPVQYVWKWRTTYVENLAAGNVPPPALLAAVRSAIACFGIASLVLVLLIARELPESPRWASLLAPVLLFSYEAFRTHASQVYADVPQLAFTLLGTWLLLRWCRRERPWQLVGAGLALGLACGTKLSAGAHVVGAMLCVALVSAPWWRRCLRIFVTAALPAAVFVAVDPHLWSRPLRTTLATIRWWSAAKATQQQDPLLAPLSVTDRLHALYLTLSRVVVYPAHGRETPGFSGLVPRVLVALLVAVAVATLVAALLRWTGRALRRRELGLAVACAGLAFPVALLVDELAMVVAGLLFLGAWQLGRQLRGENDRRITGGFAVLYLVTLAATVWWLPFDWPRYYLPLVGLTPVLGALGVGSIEAILTASAEKPD